MIKRQTDNAATNETTSIETGMRVMVHKSKYQNTEHLCIVFTNRKPECGDQSQARTRGPIINHNEGTNHKCAFGEHAVLISKSMFRDWTSKEIEAGARRTLFKFMEKYNPYKSTYLFFMSEKNGREYSGIF